MRKRIMSVIIFLCALSALLVGCGPDAPVPSSVYSKAMIKMPDGNVLDVKITDYTTYSYGAILIKTIDGMVYRTHSSHVLLYGKSPDQEEQ